MQTPENLVQDPAWLPHAYDPNRDALVFAHLPREAQRRMVFLDPRYIGDTPQSAPIPVRDLPAAAIQSAARPVHFIFHTAFCCSTLLTRALDIPRVAMGLKEPSVLVSFSDVWSSRRQTEAARAALGITIDLLSRPLAPGEAQIVKPSNAANNIAREILDLRANSKALVLYSSLDEYLLSTARQGMAARAFNRRIFQQFASTIPLKLNFSIPDVLSQTDLQIAAQTWLMQANYLGTLAKDLGPSRVRSLSSTVLLADKVGALAKVGDFFGLAADPELWASVAASDVFDKHAKSGAPYDATRKAKRDEADNVHLKEVEQVTPWARALAAHCGAPLDLGNTVLA